MKTIVLTHQTILDIAIQYTGTVENCFAIAVANGLSVSDVLSAGLPLEIPEDVFKNTDVLNYYDAKNIQPATGWSAEQDSEIPTLKGIGYMQIANGFKVS
ncbi:hypothetical protein QX233_22035 [Chryseobacterium gambrini]|uniref:LysM domain-containing protein n=1 Tax=Chryseobacterium gambrini TaxID=373672 RepID=A0A1N7R013_9FLAO|nr:MULTISPECIES: hypothetical protein [Chryseobacterium]MDN4015132.1 hypothetical protein [Chryseobacterium gambrini]QWA37256.1 hypothetical protein KKI44_15120 [Chryseobacterium sp. ZHDP1]QWA40072.1 hypothetical protein KKI44_07655 [Chryseobacterium sp. ZHDP1]SIT28456.1 hypothetical protein SAMN05421785_1294 [Chryseobacterium gambrini]